MKKYTLIFILFFSCTFVMGQANDPGLPGGDPDVPLDGGLSLLILAGAAYGIKKLGGFKP